MQFTSGGLVAHVTNWTLSNVRVLGMKAQSDAIDINAIVYHKIQSLMLLHVVTKSSKQLAEARALEVYSWWKWKYHRRFKHHYIRRFYGLNEIWNILAAAPGSDYQSFSYMAQASMFLEGTLKHAIWLVLQECQLVCVSLRIQGWRYYISEYFPTILSCILWSYVFAVEKMTAFINYNAYLNLLTVSKWDLL